ncbi:Rgg/GadR/MutR family transcriptional regulator [Vagococcus fluvialis]|uniref:Transcriptional regulator, MutR family n=1 Tax=Vagococcus fluvialis bH819 TaxID=1255619 RepID=A0A1X6WTN3_9ENTE|nr:Rgg/GadR/MutR family transcriptional regulator [Vagococcus fluvialis]SLM86976.1 Transcriptional regulator, MutR family [Vagococcus fluvialis bH819]
MANEGYTFKEIRKSRGLTQDDIVKNHISRVTLSKFENGKMVLSMSNFKYILNAVDLTLEEFDFIKNGYSYDKKQDIITSFNNLFSNTNNEINDEIIKKCEVYLSENCSVSIKCIKNVMYMLNFLNNSSNEKVTCYTKIYAADIWNELSVIDNWTLLDIKIINCCLHFFDKKSYLTISDMLIKNLNKYKNFSNIILLETSVYLNLTILFLMNNELKQAKKFSSLSLSKSLESKRIDYISLSMIRNGIICDKNSQIEKGLSLIEILNNKQLLEQINKEIAYFRT